MAANRSVGPYSSPVVNPALYLLNIDEKHPKILPANFIGTIEGDDEHILVRTCEVFEDGDCVFRVRRLAIDHLNGQGDIIAQAPMANAHFLTDHAGAVRFAWSWTDKARGACTCARATGNGFCSTTATSATWTLPLGISRDNRSAFLDAEQTDGPDVIERYDFATGKRTPLLRDAVSDPLSIIFSLDQKEPIGAWFGPGRPQARYWEPDSDDAKWHRALAKALPDSAVTVSSATADANVLVLYAYSDRDPGSFFLLDRATHKMELLFHTRPWLDAGTLADARPFAMRARVTVCPCMVS